jgi:hypothetical protein
VEFFPLPPTASAYAGDHGATRRRTSKEFEDYGVRRHHRLGARRCDRRSVFRHDPSQASDSRASCIDACHAQGTVDVTASTPPTGNTAPGLPAVSVPASILADGRRGACSASCAPQKFLEALSTQLFKDVGDAGAMLVHFGFCCAAYHFLIDRPDNLSVDLRR